MSKEEKLRSEIDDKYKWDLSNMYQNNKEVMEDINSINILIKQYDEYKGVIAKDSNHLYEFLTFDSKVDELIMNLYVYASIRNDSDMNNKESEALFNQVSNIYFELSEKRAFVIPELLETKYDVVKKYLKENKMLNAYKFVLENIYRFQNYTLNKTSEKILSNLDSVSSKFSDSFSVLKATILDYGYIVDENQEEVKLTNGNYSKYIISKNQEVRKRTYMQYYSEYKKYEKLIAIDYSGSIKTDTYNSKARGFTSSLERYLYDDGVTVKLFDGIISCVNKNLNVLQHYYELIKEVLHLKEVNEYDLSAQLCDNNKKYDLNDCKKIIISSLKPLGVEYSKILTKALNNRWIDYYSNKGKQSGYYSTSSYKGNPVILANYQDDFTSVLSITHELGHAVHSYYSNKNQPTYLAEYSIFVAEVASLTNEMLVCNYILENSTNKAEKLEVIEYLLSTISNNLFGAVRGSEFEKKAHELSDNNDIITSETLDDVELNLKKKYYSNVVKTNDLSSCAWSRIGHYYNSFYYYKYAIGISSACFVSQQILSNNKEYLNKYLEFLKLGGSKYPLDELKTIGIDLSDEKIIKNAIDYFDKMIEKFKETYNS
ncbi:MAG: oligoendopeptidase F [Bacilli bacterium]